MTDRPASKKALFRFLVISQMKQRQGQGDTRAQAIEWVASRDHLDLAGRLRRPSERTLYRWLAAYEDRGLDGLEPASRSRTQSSVVLPAELLEFFVGQKEEDSKVSVPELIRRAREMGLVKPAMLIDRTTVWRALGRMGVFLGRRKGARVRDSRRFEYPHRMMMVLADGKHFRAGVERAKRVALFFLDDHSRLGLHVVVGTSENAELFLRGLFELILRYGFFSILFLDRGPGFIAEDTIEVVAKLGIHLIWGEAGYAEGHGKVERFNRTVKADLLRFDRRPDIDPDCGALELRLQHYLREVYNHASHEALGKKTPWERFCADPRPLRLCESQSELRKRFVVHLDRRVSNDHVVSVGSTDYEVPRGHAGERVTLYRQVLDESLAILHEDRLVPLHPVDLAANARARRGKKAEPEAEVTHPLPPSAADMAFERAMGPVVGPDGGFVEPHNKESSS